MNIMTKKGKKVRILRGAISLKRRSFLMKAVIIYSRGEAWLEGKPHWEQQLVPHRQYLVDTLQDKLVSAGPFMDHTGGLVIIDVENIEEAVKVAKNDPAVVDKKFDFAVHPWEPLEGLFVKKK